MMEELLDKETLLTVNA